MKILYITLPFLLGCVLCLQNTFAQVFFSRGIHGIYLSVDLRNIDLDDPEGFLELVLEPLLSIARNNEDISDSYVLSVSDDLFRNTLLHRVLKERANPDIVKALLDQGAPLDQTNILRVSPIDQAEQMVREKLEDLQREYEQTPFLQRNIIQNWNMRRQWQDWFERRYNTRRYVLPNSSSFFCPPGTKHSMDYSDGIYHCIPQEFRFYEEEVYALLIIAEKDREQLNPTPTYGP